MPWNSNNGPGPWGSGGNNQPPKGPWGGGNNRPQRPGGPWGNGGPNKPGDLDEMLRQARDAMRNILPSGFGGASIALVAIILLGIWGASGFYRVEPDEQGVVLRFGAYTGQTTPPGLNYHLPWPIESVQTPQVTRINNVNIGFRPDARSNTGRDIPEESQMLTGDENIIDISFTVFWRIRNVGEFLFNTRTGDRSSDPESMVKSVAESGIREVMGRTEIQPALGEARAQIEQQVQALTQQVLDSYHAGIEVTQVQLQRVDPPAAVIEAFRDVQRATTDRERSRNEAEGYRNDLIPRARGEAQQVIQAAQADRDSRIARARGEAQRFTSVLQAYQSARDITMRRMYLETMEEIFRRNNAVVIDDHLQNVLPFMSLGGSGRAVPRTPLPQSPTQLPTQQQGTTR